MHEGNREPRSREELKRAWEALRLAFINDRARKELLDNDPEAAFEVCLAGSVLCWALNHTHPNGFAANLARIQAGLAALGVTTDALGVTSDELDEGKGSVH